MFLLGLLFVVVASGFSLLWVYTGGDLSSKNLQKAMPVLRRDVDAYFVTLGKRAEVTFEGARPYVKDLNEKAGAAWEELGRNVILQSLYYFKIAFLHHLLKADISCCTFNLMNHLPIHYTDVRRC
jgi:hypothetical protein